MNSATDPSSLNKSSVAQCGLCGQPVGAAVSELVGGAWQPSVCMRCGRQQLVADGGAVLQLARPIEGAVIELGEIHIRPGAVLILDRARQHYWDYLLRHARGDRGLFSPPSAGIARAAAHRPFLGGNGNVVSGYAVTHRERLWIMTTPGTVTAILAPGEF